ncbi:hypothetical protein DSM112329_04123 [Paraconexibacter sp. AEG42_29]|uniref:BioF2-like acetyltransferase domain-containing protein n=1 Tax=Paraconexibacter sp. AEG42_29 TaxID=2997339 RepID=A0AAU7AZT5_9ACTN
MSAGPHAPTAGPREACGTTRGGAPGLDAAVDAHLPGATLFNLPAFHALNLQPGQRALSLAVAGPDDGRTIGALGGVLTGGTFVSGHSAPYGGFDLARDRETPENVARLVDGALAQLERLGARAVRVRLPPAALGESEGLIAFTLLNRGFAVERCELNQHIDVTGIAGPDDYLAGLRSPARRALRRLLGPELRFATAETDADWARGHAVLAANRAAKGRRLALPVDYVLRARDALPAHAVRLHELVDDAAGRTVAAALVYRVRPGCDLVVAWGDAPDHGRERSPMNLLAYRIVEAALAAGLRTVDLGISNDPEPVLHHGGGLAANPGLHQFKQSVLATTTPRLTLVKELPRP